MAIGVNLVLLPGLDGTGIFLQPLLEALPANVRPLVVSYPVSGSNRYVDLLTFVREREVINVDAREDLRACLQPIMYLAASRDSVVPRRCVEEILRIRPSVRVETIDGEHFAMYFNPQAAARAIANHLDTLL
jgi:pimeloyl-ACP methyl ester carboxylesterase